MDIDGEQEHAEGKNSDPGADGGTPIMPTEEQAAFHRRPSR